MKHLILGLLLLASVTRADAQKRRVDSIAVSVLDRMSTMIGSMHSCSVKINSVYDIRSVNLGLVKHSDAEQLFLHGPDKLQIDAEGDKGNRSFYFNGKKLVYYSIDRNQYAELALPAGILSMIDSVHSRYGIDFPAADFFYPGFVDDIIAESSNLVYLGMTRVDGRDCFHIAGMTKDKAYQFWITDDSLNLPLKMVIVYTKKTMNPQYEAKLSDWKINPSLPETLFEFTAPAKAKKINFFSAHK